MHPYNSVALLTKLHCFSRACASASRAMAERPGGVHYHPPSFRLTLSPVTINESQEHHHHHASPDGHKEKEKKEKKSGAHAERRSLKTVPLRWAEQVRFASIRSVACANASGTGRNRSRYEQRGDTAV